MAITIGAKMDNAVKKPCQVFGAGCKSPVKRRGKAVLKLPQRTRTADAKKARPY